MKNWADCPPSNVMRWTKQKQQSRGRRTRRANNRSRLPRYSIDKAYECGHESEDQTHDYRWQVKPVVLLFLLFCSRMRIPLVLFPGLIEITYRYVGHCVAPYSPPLRSALVA